MNERIQQLAEQAGILKEQTVKAKIVKNEDGTWTSILEYPDLEKFAQLIVAECAKIADTERSNSVGCGYITKTNGMRIKEYFGVEE